MARSSVVLPAPLGPRMATTSPGSAVNAMSRCSVPSCSSTRASSPGTGGAPSVPVAARSSRVVMRYGEPVADCDQDGDGDQQQDELSRYAASGLRSSSRWTASGIGWVRENAHVASSWQAAPLRLGSGRCGTVRLPFRPIADDRVRRPAAVIADRRDPCLGTFFRVCGHSWGKPCRDLQRTRERVQDGSVRRGWATRPPPGPDPVGAIRDGVTTDTQRRSGTVAVGGARGVRPGRR